VRTIRSAVAPPTCRRLHHARYRAGASRQRERVALPPDDDKTPASAGRSGRTAREAERFGRSPAAEREDEFDRQLERTRPQPGADRVPVEQEFSSSHFRETSRARPESTRPETSLRPPILLYRGLSDATCSAAFCTSTRSPRDRLRVLCRLRQERSPATLRTVQLRAAKESERAASPRRCRRSRRLRLARDRPTRCA
jgi:hypothetical protein